MVEMFEQNGPLEEERIPLDISISLCVCLSVDEVSLSV